MPPISENVDVSVCTRPNAVNQLGLALNASIDVLEFFEEFYNVAYPLPKLGKLWRQPIDENRRNFQIFLKYVNFDSP